MTAYNREQFISEAIESVLAQDYTNFELIIVDDCSSDNTVEIANSYKNIDPRIQVYLNERNLGDYQNRNQAASYATGDLLMYVDSDDTIESSSLEFIVQQFSEHSNIDFLMIYHGDKLGHRTILFPKESIYTHFFDHSFLVIGPGGSVIRTENNLDLLLICIIILLLLRLPI